MGDFRDVNKIREWLARILGPTARAENYSDDYALMRFKNMLSFYGWPVIQRWGGWRNWA